MLGIEPLSSVLHWMGSLHSIAEPQSLTIQFMVVGAGRSDATSVLAILCRMWFTQGILHAVNETVDNRKLGPQNKIISRWTSLRSNSYCNLSYAEVASGCSWEEGLNLHGNVVILKALREGRRKQQSAPEEKKSHCYITWLTFCVFLWCKVGFKRKKMRYRSSFDFQISFSLSLSLSSSLEKCPSCSLELN